MTASPLLLRHERSLRSHLRRGLSGLIFAKHQRATAAGTEWLVVQHLMFTAADNATVRSCHGAATASGQGLSRAPELARRHSTHPSTQQIAVSNALSTRRRRRGFSSWPRPSAPLVCRYAHQSRSASLCDAAIQMMQLLFDGCRRSGPRRNHIRRKVRAP